MAAPNVVNVTSIYGKTVGAALGTSTGDILVNTAGSGKLLKLNSIIVANIDGASAADVTVYFYDLSATTPFHIAKTVTVPAKSTLVVLVRMLQSIWKKEIRFKHWQVLLEIWK